MELKAVSGIMLTVLLTGMLTLAFYIQPVRASGTIFVVIHIRADGSIEPSTTSIQRDGDVYTFTDNIFGEIVVEKNNTIVDGNGYTLHGIGPPETKGVHLHIISNVTIRNMEIENYHFGILLEGSSNNLIYHNSIRHNPVGIRLVESSNNVISGNNVTAHSDYGVGLIESADNIISGNNITNNFWAVRLYLDSLNNIISGNDIIDNGHGISLANSPNNSISGNNIANNGYGVELVWSSNNSIYHNNFIDNHQQVRCAQSTNAWDEDGEGNYWSGYKGADYTGNGIGDSPYFIDEENRDNHPLMSPWTPAWHPIPFWMRWWFWTIVAAGIVLLAVAVYFLKKRKKPTPTTPTLP